MRGFVACHRFAAIRAFSSHWQELANYVPKSKQKEILSGSFDISKRMAKADGTSALAEIDWAHYESVLGSDVVGPMKADYEATPTANLDAEIESSIGKRREQIDHLKSEVDRIDEESKPVKEIAAKQLKVLEANRTTEHTTLEEVSRRYPDIHQEVMKNIEDENYDTRFPAIDQSALRLATIKEKWDSSKFGKMTEESLNSLVAEMEDLAAPPKPKAWGDVSYTDFSDQDKDDMVAYSEKIGVELTDELIAEFDAMPDPFSLTADELAETDEGKLFQAMHNEVEKDGGIDRAILLHDRINYLRDTGDLVPNPDVVEQTEASLGLGDNTIARMTDDEFEGKTVDELTALATEAADVEDYYRATMYSYEAKVLNGDIDPTVRGIGSFSGQVNLMMQMGDNYITAAETKKRPQFAYYL